MNHEAQSWRKQIFGARFVISMFGILGGNLLNALE